jgi:hypothetical protein
MARSKAGERRSRAVVHAEPTLVKAEPENVQSLGEAKLFAFFQTAIPKAMKRLASFHERDKATLNDEQILTLEKIERAVLTADIPSIKAELDRFESMPNLAVPIMEVMYRDLYCAGIDMEFRVRPPDFRPTLILRLNHGESLYKQITIDTSPESPQSISRRFQEVESTCSEAALVEFSATMLSNLSDFNRLFWREQSNMFAGAGASN